MEEELSPEEIRLLSQKLSENIDELTQLITLCKHRAETVDLDQAAVGRVTRIDAMQQQSMAQANLAQYEILLKQTRAAFRKIELGDYGYCAVCEECIGFKRLSIKPEGPLCINCQNKSEQA